MGFMQWSENLATGIQEADEEHQKLLQMINTLYEAVKQGKGRDVLDGLLDELLEYAEYHFSTEENLMEKYDYPELAIHRREHETFKAKIRDFFEKKTRGEATLTLEVMNFLSDWLLNHIRRTDKKYGSFLLEKLKK